MEEEVEEKKEEEEEEKEESGAGTTKKTVPDIEYLFWNLKQTLFEAHIGCDTFGNTLFTGFFVNTKSTS
ncbi:hypothetical protein ABVT39_020858 [Epinephelus coioides]